MNEFLPSLEEHVDTYLSTKDEHSGNNEEPCEVNSKCGHHD